MLIQILPNSEAVMPLCRTAILWVDLNNKTSPVSAVLRNSFSVIESV